MKKLFNYFLQGLLYVAPIGVTIYMIYLIFTFIDGLLKSAIESILGFNIPGLGIIVIFLIITLLGFIGQSIIFRPFSLLIEKLISKAPILQTIYSTVKDFLTAFMGKEKKFNRPVLVKVNPVTNLEKMGFLTQSDLSRLNIKDKVAVYFPHSYNFSGELFIVPSEQVTPLDLHSTEAMKFIVSGGVSGI